MKIVDPLKRRAEFEAHSMQVGVKEGQQYLSFIGDSPDQFVSIASNQIATWALHSGLDVKLPIWKIQLLESLSWVTLDFTPDLELSRIVVHISKLDFDYVHLHLSTLIEDTPVLYFRHGGKE